MKKIIEILFCIVVLLSIVGCSNNKNEEQNEEDAVITDIKKVSIYKSGDIMGKKQDDTPFLVIEDKEGLILFENLIDNAKRIEGILDLKAPSYIAEINYSDKNEIIYFNIHTSSGMYVNSVDTSTGYNFELEDIESFINVYEEYFNLSNKME